ncbi:MAG: hypothetical protein EDR02_14250 [Actinobacteria bacterium]|nr:MAG: hypothetical protein EDR02_14250 [Actinomycetota bacterium]
MTSSQPGGWPSSLKVAVTARSELTVTVTGFCEPDTPPDQPSKDQPSSGTAVNVTCEPAG